MDVAALEVHRAKLKENEKLEKSIRNSRIDKTVEHEGEVYTIIIGYNNCEVFGNIWNQTAVLLKIIQILKRVLDYYECSFSLDIHWKPLNSGFPQHPFFFNK